MLFIFEDLYVGVCGRGRERRERESERERKRLYVHYMYLGACESHKRASDHLKLKFQEGMSNYVCAIIKPRSSG